MVAIGAGLAVMTGMMTGLGEGTCAAHACDAIGKNPEVESKIRSTMILGIALKDISLIYQASGKINAILLLGCALAESTAIYAFVVALILAAKV